MLVSAQPSTYASVDENNDSEKGTLEGTIDSYENLQRVGRESFKFITVYSYSLFK